MRDSVRLSWEKSPNSPRALGTQERPATPAALHLAPLDIAGCGQPQQGTIFTHFKGVAFPITSPHQVGEGSFVIRSGTGAYAGIRGRGSFLIVVDQISNQFIGTETGNVES
ncbi:MAG TPA: hypothetical protein VHK65_09765 [Candidatus Dormibacteraeota bacterium]|nr:hypothetical protein [Candidatus Dormibacteraeota bacterium]